MNIICENCGKKIREKDISSNSIAKCSQCNTELDNFEKTPFEKTQINPQDPKIIQSYWKKYLAYTILAYIILTYGAYNGPWNTARLADSMASYTPELALSNAFNSLIFIVVICLGISFIIALLSLSINKKYFKKTLVISYAVTIIVHSLIFCYIDVSGINRHGRDVPRLNNVLVHDTGKPNWVDMNLFEIRMHLPEFPKIERISVPFDKRDLVKRGYIDQATIAGKHYSIIIEKIDFKTNDVNFEDIQNDILKYTDDSTEIHVINEDHELIHGRYKALHYEISYKSENDNHYIRSSIISDKGTCWMITVLGNGYATKDIWYNIKSSISIGTR